ncbi:MAG: hypothetical protein KBB64_02400 [Bacteroidia bacterium]|nr:hypothetical protein [Bacteroidia bacterium]
MTYFIEQLKFRNESLFYFGLICLVFSLFFLLASVFDNTQVNNVSAWHKPFKFSMSTFLFSWAMGWYCFYLPDFNVVPFNLTVILLLGFEIIYISIQAGRGQLSHFNLSTPFYSFMYSMMAIAATVVTIYTAYVGYLFFATTIPDLPDYYLVSIRWGIILFVIFSLEGFVMGSNLSHTIGGKDGGIGIPLLNWSTTFGDPRIAHFIGMHALQVLPLLSWYLLKNRNVAIIIIILYAILAVFTLVQALKGKPMFKSTNIEKGTNTH